MDTEAKTRGGPTHTTTCSNTEHLRRLLKSLERGEIDGPLQVMALIEAVTHAMSDNGQSATDHELKKFLMSENNCRFCS